MKISANSRFFLITTQSLVAEASFPHAFQLHCFTCAFPLKDEAHVLKKFSQMTMMRRENDCPHFQTPKIKKSRKKNDAVYHWENFISPKGTLETCLLSVLPISIAP